MLQGPWEIDSSLISKNLQAQMYFCMGGNGEKGGEEMLSSDWGVSCCVSLVSSRTGAFAQPACLLGLCGGGLTDTGLGMGQVTVLLLMP